MPERRPARGRSRQRRLGAHNHLLPELRQRRHRRRSSINGNSMDVVHRSIRCTAKSKAEIESILHPNSDWNILLKKLEEQRNNNDIMDDSCEAPWGQLLMMLRNNTTTTHEQLALLILENDPALDRFLMRAYKHYHQKASCNHNVNSSSEENQNPNDDHHRTIHDECFYDWEKRRIPPSSSILQCFWELWNHKEIPRSLIKTSIRNCRGLHVWLIQAWQCHLERGRHRNIEPHDRNDDILLVWIIKVLSTMCLRDAEIRSTVIQSSQIVRLMEESLSSKTCKNGDVLVALFDLFKHLTIRGQKEEQWKLFNTLLDPLLLFGLGLPEATTVPSARQIQDENATAFPSTVVLETASAILWNWAATDLEMAMAMGANDRVWKHLENLWAREYFLSDTVLCNLASTVGTITASLTTDRCKVAETDERSAQKIYENQTWLVPILLSAFEEDRPCADKNYRRRCMRTLRCLSSCTWGRAFLFTNAPSLMHIGNVLTQALRSDLVPDNDTRLQACETIAYLLPAICQDTSSQNSIFFGPSVEMAIIQIVEEMNKNMEPNSKTYCKLVLAACRALCVCLRHSPWQRGANCFSHCFLEELFSVLQEQVDQPYCHEVLSELMINLLTPSQITNIDCQPRIPGISSLIVSSPAALDLLCMLTSATPSPDFEVSRQNAVRALSMIASESDLNKKALADHDNILTALVNVCLIHNNNDEDGSIKQKAKSLVLTLVPEI